MSLRFLFAVVALPFAAANLGPRLAAQPQEPEEPLPRQREMPGRGIKGAGFAGLKPAEAAEAAKLLEKGKQQEAEGELRAALKTYKRVYKRFPRSVSAPEAYHHTAEIELKRGKPIQAFEAIDAIVRAYPSYGQFNELVAEEYRIAYDLINGQRLKMFGFLPGFPNEERGIYFMERLVFNAPYSDFAPLALMNVAEAHSRAHRTEEAIDALDRLITNYPNSILAPKSYLRMAQIHEQTIDGPLYDQASTKEAINYYKDFLILFPRDKEVGNAEDGLARMEDMLAQSRFKIAEFYYLKRARYPAAKAFYNEAITIAPNSETAQNARERIAQLEVDEARYEAELIAQAEKQQGRRPGFLSGFFGSTQPNPTPPEAPGPREETSNPAATPPPAPAPSESNITTSPSP